MPVIFVTRGLAPHLACQSPYSPLAELGRSASYGRPPEKDSFAGDHRFHIC